MLLAALIHYFAGGYSTMNVPFPINPVVTLYLSPLLFLGGLGLALYGLWLRNRARSIAPRRPSSDQIRANHLFGPDPAVTPSQVSISLLGTFLRSWPRLAQREVRSYRQNSLDDSWP